MNRKRKIFICLNLFIFITMLIAVISTLAYGSRGARLDNGIAVGASELNDGTFGGTKVEYWHHVVSFTVLSNIFLGIVALVAAIIAIKHPRKPLSKTLSIWYLVAASSAMLTCLTVIFFLAPMRAMQGKNYFDMLLEQMFFLHFINPILGAVSYIFFLDTTEKVKLKTCLFTILPPVIYSSPYIFCVCVVRCWPDFYGLTFGGRYYIIPFVYLAFCVVTFVIGSSLAALHNHFFKLK